MIRIYFAIIFLDINFHKYSSPTRIKILGVMFVVCPQYCLPTGVPDYFLFWFWFFCCSQTGIVQFLENILNFSHIYQSQSQYWFQIMTFCQYKERLWPLCLPEYDCMQLRVTGTGKLFWKILFIGNILLAK